MNDNKIQKCYGYQRCYLSFHKYITSGSIRKCIPLLPLGRYLMSLTKLNRYETTDSDGIFYFIIISRNVSIGVRYEVFW